MDKNKDILIVGSGLSANNCKFWNIDDKVVVCINNAWKLLPNSFDYHVCSGDFDRRQCPVGKGSISYPEYSEAIENLKKRFQWETKSAQHHVGYCIFFQAFYWVIDYLKPYKIGTIGCDYDYPEINVNRWFEGGCPNPQNNYNKEISEKIDVIKWGNLFFNGCEESHFYGHGTPEPLRLGKKHLVQKFELAKEVAQKLGITVVNYSFVSGLNTFNKERYGLSET